MRRSTIPGPGFADVIAACLCLGLLFGACRNHSVRNQAGGDETDRGGPVGGRTKNHLAGASSPYLRAQAGDPVDWHEWGDEALGKAKREDKPLLISVGYSACHWCHMMEKESFTDTAVARIMNERFVCIKVDRDERPDVDKEYSDACQLITGGSGWPLNAFALPDGKPFFAGTYYSRSSWINLLTQIDAAYRSQRNKVELQAQTLASGIADPGLTRVSGNDAIRSVDKARYRRLFETLYPRMDPVNGGLQGTPKFPVPSVLEFVMQYHFATHDKRALDIVRTSLTKMALGGIWDQLGGGFGRYATDPSWHIPHFEKMLGENAELLSAYAHAYQLTHDELFKRVVQGIIEFAERDLSHRDGGYFSSVDADTKEGEGEFYTWSAAGLRKEVPEDYGLIAEYYHISDEGNWKEGKNVLFATETPVQFAQRHGADAGMLAGRLSAARQRLLTAREKRGIPSVDKKILASWNALLLSGYLDAYAALGEPGYLQSAMRTALFLEKNMLGKDGGLWHVFEDGKGLVEACLDDYAYLASAYLRLYELTFSKHWLDLAKLLTDHVLGVFYDRRSGMFFYSGRPGRTEGASDSALIREIAVSDNGLPSSNAVMAEVLYKLGHYFENETYLDRSVQMVSLMLDRLTRDGAAYYARWACQAGRLAYGVNEVAIVGSDAQAKTLALQRDYLPFSLFMGSTGEENLPLLEGKRQAGRTMIYICTNKVCKRPVAETSAALDQLRNKPTEK